MTSTGLAPGNSFLDRFWRGPGGAGHTLSIALPLILSTSSHTVMQFVDRRFLADYSSDAFGGAGPAGMLCFLFISFFLGTALYVNTFVAQYTGAERDERVGAAVWQGLYFAGLSWLVLAPFGFAAHWLFAVAGHDADIMSHEITYFRILIVWSGLPICNAVLSSFYSGRGKTWIVMWVRVVAVAINIPLDYALIFGNWGAPEMGIAGAATATVISMLFSTVAFAVLVFLPSNCRRFGLLKQCRFDADLFKRLVRFGFPNGAHFLIDIFAWTLFLFLIGRLGAVELKATNATWALNSIAFIPMLGFSMGVSIIVGQEIGRGRIAVARRSVDNAFRFALVYMGGVALMLLLIPRFVLGLLITDLDGEEMTRVVEMSIMLLRFVAFYSLFDSAAIIFSGALKGAGDTKFVMWASGMLSFATLVVPTWSACTFWTPPIGVLWCFASAFIMLISIVLYLRYRGGAWESMKVIESTSEPDGALPVETPIIEG